MPMWNIKLAFVILGGVWFRNIRCEPWIEKFTTSICPPLDPSLDDLTQEDFISELTHSCRYDHLSRPPGSLPLQVVFQIDVKHMENIDNTQFKTNLLVQMQYRDERLNFGKLSPNRGIVVGQEALKTKIWVPHLFITNEKTSSLMGSDRKDVFIQISPSGDVSYSHRMTTTFYCAMDLRKFPFDQQVCQLIWSSWVYNESSLQLRWSKDDPYIVSDNLQLTEFSLNRMSVKDSKSYISNESSRGRKEAHSSLIFAFQLKREAGYYILEYFLPSIFLVAMSWVSFWIQADASPPRTVLGTSTMLSLITLNGNLMKDLPKVPYVKASEVWFFGGAAFIFCSLAEFAFVNVIWRRRKKVALIKHSSKYIIKGALSPRLARQDLRKSASFSSLDSKDTETYLTDRGSSTSLNVPTINTPANTENIGPNSSSATPTQAQQTWAEMTPHEVAIWIDRKARIAFPAMFLIYNLFYWSYVYFG